MVAGSLVAAVVAAAAAGAATGGAARRAVAILVVAVAARGPRVVREVVPIALVTGFAPEPPRGPPREPPRKKSGFLSRL
jgi:hypothetical protein